MDKISIFMDTVAKVFPGRKSFTRKELNDLHKDYNISIPWNFLNEDKTIRPARFTYTKNHDIIEEETMVKSVEPVVKSEEPMKSEEDFKEYIPFEDKNYVEVGDNFKIVSKIVSQNEFYPAYIYGIPGLGKTSMVEQACAKYKRPFFRTQISKETIDEDLIGSYRLKDGNTIWQDGPVIKAYRCGGVLLLDEFDLNPHLMILQGILEGKPFYIKQTGEVVYPKPGFTIFATGNSKGLGETDFVGTMSLNEAQRDRFAIYLEQDIMSITMEKKIANRYISNENMEIEEHLKNTIFNWIEITRKAFKEDKIKQYISTRRVYFLFKTINFIKDPSKSVERVLSCYDDESKEALIMLWKACYEVKEEPKEEVKEETKEEPQKVEFEDNTFKILYC
ncbi:MAG: AAA family ATPase [Bacteroidales bacterium]|nr:AAA family ATPase [Bacteroidales bacterium]